MKKMVSVILSVCLLLTLLPTTVFAADKTADAGAKIVEKSYDESTRILTVDMQIKLPNAVGITSVATMISYDSSKLTLLHASNDETSYIATETRMTNPIQNKNRHCTAKMAELHSWCCSGA